MKEGNRMYLSISEKESIAHKNPLTHFKMYLDLKATKKKQPV